ncbi:MULTISPECIES: mercuric transporter MerT family protein [Aurantimonadaceae]|uniref:Mercuric transport protein MerT n=1 Tax=Jiella pelagia TaxID=2986949 RepID=A0ABY7C6T2_9HYPH|nr:MULTISPECIES: mercuric transporter MerT family protein [Aurantimonadaceae]WAP71408.1 mercuric transporter MerT family protein [Jiella pelagia]
MNGHSEPLERRVESSIGDAGRTRLTVAGGLMGALAASSCCILPLVLFSFGIGGAWVGNLTALAPYQPFFVAVTLASLGYGYWRVYRKPAACVDGDTCARPLPNLLVKVGLWAAIAIVAAALAFPFVAPLLLGL